MVRDAEDMGEETILKVPRIAQYEEEEEKEGGRRAEADRDGGWIRM